MEGMSANNCFDLHLKDRSSIQFSFKEGKIHFFDTERNDEIGISLIVIKEEFRRNSIFTNLINYIISNKSINKIWVFQTSDIMALILQTRKFDDKYFRNCFTGEFLWVRFPEYDLDKSHYDHQKSQEISENLSPLMHMLKTHPISEVQKIIYSNNDYRKYMC